MHNVVKALVKPNHMITEFESAISRDIDFQGLVALSYSDLIVARPQVQFWEIFCAMESINQIDDDG